MTTLPPLNERATPPSELAAISAEVNAEARPALEFIRFADLAAEVDAEGPRQWLIEGIWPAGDYGVHAAAAKAQKTWNSVDLAVSVATGTPWLGRFPIGTPGPVLMFYGEGGRHGIVRRVRAVLRERGIEDDDVPIELCIRAPHLSNEQHLAEFGVKVTQARPALVILDPLYLAAKGGDKGDLIGMGSILEAAQLICQPAGASLWVVHHNNRSGRKGPAAISGAGPWEWARVIVTADVKASRTDPATEETDVTTQLAIIGGDIPDRSFRVRRRIVADEPADLDSPLHVGVTVTDTDDSTDEADDDREPAALKLLQALTAADGQPRTSEQLVDWVAQEHGHGLRRETVSRHLNALETEGLVDHVDQGSFQPKLWMLHPETDPA